MLTSPQGNIATLSSSCLFSFLSFSLLKDTLKKLQINQEEKTEKKKKLNQMSSRQKAEGYTCRVVFTRLETIWVFFFLSFRDGSLLSIFFS
jgi:hypothetical protein